MLLICSFIYYRHICEEQRICLCSQSCLQSSDWLIVFLAGGTVVTDWTADLLMWRNVRKCFKLDIRDGNIVDEDEAVCMPHTHVCPRSKLKCVLTKIDVSTYTHTHIFCIVFMWRKIWKYVENYRFTICYTKDFFCVCVLQFCELVPFRKKKSSKTKTEAH